MNQIPFKLIFTGLFISLVGTLPFGVLNVIVLKISVSEGYMPAFIFSIGAVLIEMVYVCISLIFMQRLQQLKNFKARLHWISFIVMLGISIWSTIEALAPPHATTQALTHPTTPRFLYGVFMSAINPLQIPFWLGWNTILMARGILVVRPKTTIIYALSVGIGTMFGFGIFMLLGTTLSDRLTTYDHWFKVGIAILFWAVCLFQFYKLMRLVFFTKKEANP